MEIVKKLSIPAPYFFDKVVESVIYDIHIATGQTMDRSQLTGFGYIKEFSNKRQAKIQIEEFIENQSYQFKTSTTKNEYVARYEIIPIDEKSCEVRYHETMESFGRLQQINDKLVAKLAGFLKKRHFKRMLTMIEQSY